MENPSLFLFEFQMKKENKLGHGWGSAVVERSSTVYIWIVLTSADQEVHGLNPALSKNFTAKKFGIKLQQLSSLGVTTTCDRLQYWIMDKEQGTRKETIML